MNEKWVHLIGIKKEIPFFSLFKYRGTIPIGSYHWLLVGSF